MKADMKSLIVAVALIFMSFVGCSTPRKVANPDPHAVPHDYYFYDNGMPIREVKDQDFFFKKCNVDNSGSYPSKTNYDCNEP